MKGTAITVDKRGMTFLIERFSRDCGELQYVREFTQNSIDAIRRAGIANGVITWDTDEAFLRDTGVRKLAITDNGEGMTGEEMVQHIGRLSSSGQEQSLQGNYGLGAKISAATRNPHGLLYLSWRKGRGASLRLHKRAGEYEIERTDIGDGEYREWRDLDDTEKPAVIGEHGTRVILMGQSEGDDTSRPPGQKASYKWLLLYLNRRYFRVPQNIEIRVLAAREAAVASGGKGDMRRVQGQGTFLDKHATSKGVVELEDADVHWWILPARKDEGGELPDTSEFERAGHVSALYQNELYELQNGRAGQIRLQSFGVVFGYRRVVLYAEPRKQESLTTNTARTALILDEEPLPWAEWAAEFREKLPQEIRALEEEASAGAVDRERTKSVEKTLEDLVRLYRLTRYVRRTTGSETFEVIGDDGGGGRGMDTIRPSDGERQPTGRAGPVVGRGGRTGSLVYGRKQRQGEKGEKQNSTDFPNIVWKSDAPGPDEQKLDPDELVDRAARYVVESNLVFVNRDFNAFVDLEEHMVKLFHDRPGARNVIRSVMKRWIEVQLSEVIAGARSLRSREQWSEGNFQTAISEEALTATVMPRYHIVFAIKREVGTKLGSMS